jgi:hypothetical protein
MLGLWTDMEMRVDCGCDKGSRRREQSGRDSKEEGWLDSRGRIEVRRNLANCRGGRMVKREEGEV